MGADFGGYATKANIRCSDGRTILPNAFKEQSGEKVPLVWAHAHGEPSNVLGYAILENREDGVYAKGYFNDSPAAKDAKILVQHGDIRSLSIYANSLVERAKQVMHGKIREVSLVLAGANPGAVIDYVAIQHADGDQTVLDDEAVISMDLPLDFDLEHAEKKTQSDDEDEDDLTIADVYEQMTETQKNVVQYMVGAAVEAAVDSAKHSEDDTDDEKIEHDDQNHSDEDTLDDQEGTEMAHNVFENGTKDSKKESYELTHTDIKDIFEGAKRLGSVKDAVEDFALKHGIENIETLFPDAKAVSTTPEFLKRRTEWVATVMNGVRNTPFSRIKSLMADLTLDDARAKGYVKGNMKREEFFKVTKRVTTPQTIYKKQKLDRDDILDITDFDVVTWLKAELRLMLEEELARAILFGDGRSNADEDKIQEDHIRPIATDHELYATTVYVNVDGADSSWEDVVDALVLQRSHYRGSGNPTFFTTENNLARMLLIKDSLGRRIYPTATDLAAAIRCSSIVAVEGMEADETLVGVMVNLQDYSVGADRGGDLTMFDDFDVDFNQHKYLLETRVSGALTKVKSALVVRKTAAAAQPVEPEAPTFDGSTITVPTVTGVVYTPAGPSVPVAEGETVTVNASPADGYYFATNANDSWTFTNEA